MIAALKEKAKAAEEIAKGNVKAEINVASDQDSLGHAMVTMKSSIGGYRRLCRVGKAQTTKKCSVAFAI